MNTGLGISIVFFYGAAIGLALLLGWIFELPSVWRMEPRAPGPIPEFLGALLGIGAGLATHAVSTFVRRRFGWMQEFYEKIGEMLGSPSTGLIVLMAVASAVGEEVLFRGALLPLIGIWPQAIIFGLLHVGPGRSFFFWPFYAAAMGLAFGLLYQASGTLLAPILAHFTVNYFGLASLRKMEPDQ